MSIFISYIIKSNLIASTFLIHLPSGVVTVNPPYPFDTETISPTSIFETRDCIVSKTFACFFSKKEAGFLFRNIIFISVPFYANCLSKILIHSNKYFATVGFTALPILPTLCDQSGNPSSFLIVLCAGISRILFAQVYPTLVSDVHCLNIELMLPHLQTSPCNPILLE